GDALGRLNGAIALGFVIGLMVALIEAGSREFWLEVRYGTRETRLVTLGETPVTIGNDARHSTVYAREAARPIAYRYTVVDGGVVCVDYATEQSMDAPIGDQKVMGNVTATVCSGAPSSNSVVTPTKAPTAPPPPPTPTATQAAMTPATPVILKSGGEVASPAPPKPPTMTHSARPTTAPTQSKPNVTASGLPTPPPPPSAKSPQPKPATQKPASPTPAPPTAPPPFQPAGKNKQQVINPIAPPPPPPGGK
ncbi:MAG: hypothetical protein O3A00_15765, partial [Planctomycetota bacterium]|nr:hypothetical protein [Planctomycetota bacterium]